MRVDRSELHAGRWYVVLQGSVQRPMMLEACTSSTDVVMRSRNGKETQVSIFKIIEGWDPEKGQKSLLRKAGEPDKPTLTGFDQAHARSGDPVQSHKAARKASRSCGRVAYMLLDLLSDGIPRTHEQMANELPEIKSQSPIRGRCADLVAHGYAELHDNDGKTMHGNKSARWTITVAGREAWVDAYEAATA